ncbi:MAG: dTDP-4-dehydrorhamnose reductase [Bacillota bacterium]
MNNRFQPRIMLTGKNGQIGWELQRTLASLGEVIALNRQQLDLANPDRIRELVREIKPNLIVNAAAYTAVDKAEEETELAMAVNGIAPGILAAEAKRLNAAIIHYSTDYVFDGTKANPYNETDVPHPPNVYGRTKLAGEYAVQASGAPYLILRVSWVYGIMGNNFMLTILRLARERGELRIVDDQVGSPTWSRMLAEVTAQILAQGYPTLEDKKGIYHLSAGGETTWYGFAKAILAQNILPLSGLHSVKLIPVSTLEYPTAARRPAYSLLSNTRLNQTFGLTMPAWDLALKLAVDSFLTVKKII